MILGRQGRKKLLGVAMLTVTAIIIVARADTPTVNYQYDKLGNLVSMQSCSLTTCAAQGKNCNTIPDGCGKTLYCGACGWRQICTAANICCTPRTCNDAPGTCGALADGCGNTVQCPGCPLYYSCINNQCVATGRGTCSGRCDGSCSESITNNCMPGYSPSYGFYCDYNYRNLCKAFGSTACTCL